MDQYNLSNISAVNEASGQVRVRANQEPNQSSYNAAWLHGYANALSDAAQGLTPQWNLMDAIVDNMREQCDDTELNFILRENLGMTDEDILALGFDLP